MHAPNVSGSEIRGSSKQGNKSQWVNCNARTACVNSSGVKPDLGLDQARISSEN